MKDTKQKEAELKVIQKRIDKALKETWTDPIDAQRIPTLNPTYNFDVHDDLVRNVKCDLKENRNVLLVGHAGTGKTSLYEQIAARIPQPVSRVNLNGQTTISDFVGMWGIKNRETYWIDGALPTAMKKGYFLILDELDFAEPAILSVLNSVLEENGKLFLKEKGDEVIVPHRKFRVLATANTIGCMNEYKYMYSGANLMNAAFIDRFRVYHVDYLSKEAEIEILTDVIPDLTDKIAEALVSFAHVIREAFDKQEMDYTVSLRNLIDLGHMTMRKVEYAQATGKLTTGRIIPEAIKDCMYGKMSKEDSIKTSEIVQRVLSQK